MLPLSAGAWRTGCRDRPGAKRSQLQHVSLRTRPFLREAKPRRSIFLGCSAQKTTVPAPSLQALPYVLTFAIDGDKKAVEQTLQDASTLYRLRADPPSDGDSLARRAQADFGPLLDALWGLGFYNATLVFDVAGVPLTLGEDPARAAAAAEAIGPALPFR